MSLLASEPGVDGRRATEVEVLVKIARRLRGMGAGRVPHRRVLHQ
jgi:hypothetical protein